MEGVDDHKIDLIVTQASCTAQEAREALDSCGGDVVDALVLLASRGAPSAAAGSSSADNESDTGGPSSDSPGAPEAAAVQPSKSPVTPPNNTHSNNNVGTPAKALSPPQGLYTPTSLRSRPSADPRVFTPSSLRRANTPAQTTGTPGSALTPHGRGKHQRVKSFGEWFQGVMSPSVAAGKKADIPGAKADELLKAVEEERVSRHLFTGTAAQLRNEIPRTGLFFEVFAEVVYGEQEPELKWAWPDSEKLQNIALFPHFCLPWVKGKGRNGSLSSSSGGIAVMEEFVFCVTPTPDQRLLGCCVTKEGRSCVLLTRFPFLDVTFHVLRGIFDASSRDDVIFLLERFHVNVPDFHDSYCALACRTDPERHMLLWTRGEGKRFGEEDASAAEWFLPVLLEKVCSQEAFFFCLLSYVMLEYKVVLHSESMDLVSSSAFALADLVRPFCYQAVFLPVLPTALSEVVQAPVPFLVGMHSSCVGGHLGVDGSVVFVNLDTLKFVDFAGKKYAPPPKIPEEAELKKLVGPLLNQLSSLSRPVLLLRSSDTLPPRSPKSRDLCRQFWLKLSTFWDEIFSDFRRHCFRDLTKADEPVSLFLPDAFIAEKGPQGEEWYRKFFATQMWISFSDEKRARFDLQRRNSLLSKGMQGIKK